MQSFASRNPRRAARLAKPRTLPEIPPQKACRDSGSLGPAPGSSSGKSRREVTWEPKVQAASANCSFRRIILVLLMAFCALFTRLLSASRPQKNGDSALAGIAHTIIFWATPEDALRLGAASAAANCLAGSPGATRLGWSFEQGLELVKKAGYDGIELWLGEVPWFQMNTTDTQVTELRRKVENAGLVVSNVSTGLHWKTPLSARDPKVRAEAIRIVERELETAQLLGCDAILVVTGLVTQEVPYNEVYQRCLDAMQQLTPVAAKARVKIGCENCNSEQRFLLTPREFWTFLNEVDSPFVGIHLDVGNIHDTGFAEQWIEMHGPRITRIHLKDVMKKRGRCCDTVYTSLFIGDNDWPAIRAALTKVRYDGWLIAEMEARYRYAQDQQFYDTAADMDRLISAKL
ncbi:MAG: hypothetical protein DMG42_33605 [Acidobacteria bacterium]|nr:MAG: hypothetical protein DMG42_33605 [Acidobacteriota bacterium]